RRCAVMHTRPVETKMPRLRLGSASPVSPSFWRAHANLAFGLLAVLGGCAVRAPHPDGLPTQTNLPDRTTHRLVAGWEQQVTQYIGAEGGGDPAVIARSRVLHSRDARRPARITFDALDVDAAISGRDGWDLEGVLIGKQSTGTRNWYVFLVAVVARSGYRPA